MSCGGGESGRCNGRFVGVLGGKCGVLGRG